MNPHFVTRVTCTGPGLRTSGWWARHFERDLARDWTVPWEGAPALSAAERRRIGRSIAEFQRGESSEGRRYLAQSQRFAAATGDAAFHEASARFVATESLHAGELLRFMETEGIACLRTSPADAIFRWLRGPLDLAWMSRMLLIAELIAQDYYECLRVATGHPALRRLCDRIVSEERAHVRFQIERIARVEAQQPRWVIAWRDRAQEMIGLATTAVVWLGHRSVLRERHTCRAFFSDARRRQRRAMATLRALRERMQVCASYGLAGGVGAAAAGGDAARAGLRGSFSSRIAAS